MAAADLPRCSYLLFAAVDLPLLLCRQGEHGLPVLLCEVELILENRKWQKGERAAKFGGVTKFAWKHKIMFDAGALISLREVIGNQRQISCLAGFNSMRNESVGRSTRGNKHLETTCVNTYLTEVDKGRRRGGGWPDKHQQSPLLKSKHFSHIHHILCKWASCESHEKPL